jgi:type III secretory pathway component EscT
MLNWRRSFMSSDGMTVRQQCWAAVLLEYILIGVFLGLFAAAMFWIQP